MGKKTIFAVLALATLFLFQNCGKAGFESQDQLNLNSSSLSSTTPTVSGAPFPFDAGANVVSYMSCPTVTSANSNDAYYSFKVLGVEPTAFNNISTTLTNAIRAGQPAVALPFMADGGIRLNPNYVAMMDKNFKGLGSTIPTTQLQSILQTSADYQDARLQIGFRKITDLRNTVLNFPAASGGQSTPAAQWVFDKFSSPVLSKYLAQNRDKYVTAFPTNATDMGSFNASLPYATLSETDMTNFRSLLSRDYYLTMSYIKNDSALAGNSLPQLNAYPAGTDGIQGKGYAIQFGNPPPGPLVSSAVSYTNSDGSLKPRAAVPTRTGITEYDLSTGTAISGTWSCFSYGIVRYQDKDLCPVEDYSSLNRNRGQLDLVRKVLRAEDWQVNTSLGCIVPTGANSAFSCYNTTSSNPVNERAAWTSQLASGGGFGANYSVAPPLTTGIEYRYWNQNCGGQYRECVNFATFCYKQR